MDFHNDPFIKQCTAKLKTLRTALVNVQELPRSATLEGGLAVLQMEDGTTLLAPSSREELKLLIAATTDEARDRIKAMGEEQLQLLGMMEDEARRLGARMSVPVDESRAYVKRTTLEIIEFINTHPAFSSDLHHKNGNNAFVPGHARGWHRAQKKAAKKAAKKA